MYQKILLFIISALTSVGLISNQPISFDKNNNSDLSDKSNESTMSANVNDSDNTVSTTEENKNIVVNPTTEKPEVVYIKPDYSNLIKKVEEIKKCWKSCETYTVIGGDAPDWCKEGDLNIDKRMECLRIETKEKSVSCDSKREKALILVNKALESLRNGVFVDIYDLDQIPQCPNTSRTLMPTR